MNLRDDLRLLHDIAPGEQHEGEGVFKDPGAREQLIRHIALYHRHGTPDEVEYHTQAEGRILR